MVNVSQSIRNFTYKNVALNIYYINKGEGLPKHEHEYRHGVICLEGSCRIGKENFELLINKNSQFVELKENEWHELEAMEDKTIILNVTANSLR